MQYLVECWADCGEEFAVYAPSRGSDELTSGVSCTCTSCGHKYAFTLDGDGEPDLQDTSGDPNSLGANITGHDSERSTNF